MNKLVFAAISAFTLPFAAFAQKPINTINGEIPPGVVRGLVNTKTLIDEIRPDGNRVLSVRGTRLPGTRAPIHIHEYSGMTCLFSGQLVFRSKGKPNRVFGPGDCYHMPANTPMSASNRGSEPVNLVDIFVLPIGESPAKVIETGFSSR